MTIGDNVYDMRKRDDINGNGYWEVTVTNEQLDLKIFKFYGWIPIIRLNML